MRNFESIRGYTSLGLFTLTFVVFSVFITTKQPFYLPLFAGSIASFLVCISYFDYNAGDGTGTGGTPDISPDPSGKKTLFWLKNIAIATILAMVLLLALQLSVGVPVFYRLS